MKFNEEHIHQLLFQKIAGTITDEDNVIADRAIEKNPEIKQFWESLTNKMDKGKGKAFLTNIDSTEAWTKTVLASNKINRSPIYLKKWIPISIAAMFALALPLFWIYNKPITRTSLASSTAISKSKDVYITTSTGNEISLGSPSVIQLGKAKFNAGQDSLSYSVPASAPNEWVTLVVPNTKDYRLKLIDGTIIQLNSGSSLKFPIRFDQKNRDVYLKGEAYFEVSKNPKQQFIVHTDYADVAVYGTSFNVNAFDTKHFAISLVEGSVAAKRDAQLLMLRPGEEAILNDNYLKSKPFDGVEILSWRKGTYIFHNKPLSEIAMVLSRWFDVEVSYQNQSISLRNFSGAIYKDQSIKEVLDNLKLTAGLEAELKNKKLIFK